MSLRDAELLPVDGVFILQADGMFEVICPSKVIFITAEDIMIS